MPSRPRTKPAREIGTILEPRRSLHPAPATQKGPPIAASQRGSGALRSAQICSTWNHGAFASRCRIARPGCCSFTASTQAARARRLSNTRLRMARRGAWCCSLSPSFSCSASRCDQPPQACSGPRVVDGRAAGRRPPPLLLSRRLPRYGRRCLSWPRTAPDISSHWTAAKLLKVHFALWDPQGDASRRRPCRACHHGDRRNLHSTTPVYRVQLKHLALTGPTSVRSTRLPLPVSCEDAWAAGSASIAGSFGAFP